MVFFINIFKQMWIRLVNPEYFFRFFLRKYLHRHLPDQKRFIKMIPL